ncbi:hypothetical protein T08_3197 [Trichinella sp. T8]|nr:hypothetical protein T08_944 [Trichinella sp. T8]KRZ87562.1 hypothetical protein T08_3197 [Trichinella sp. T8]
MRSTTRNWINFLITTLPQLTKNKTTYFIIAHLGDRCMNEPEFKQQYQIGVLQPGETERRMASVGLPLAVLIKQKWRRGLITSEFNFNSFSISSSVLIRTVKMTLSHKL